MTRTELLKQNAKKISYWALTLSLILENKNKEALEKIRKIKRLIVDNYNVGDTVKPEDNGAGKEYELLAIQSLFGKVAKGIALRDFKLLRNSYIEIYKKLIILEKYYIF